MRHLTIVALVLFVPGISLGSEKQSLSLAKHRLQAAELRLRLYERVEYPSQLRELKAKIKLTDATIEMLKRRIREWERFDRSSVGSAVTMSLENARLDLLEAELRAENLEEERLLLLRYHSDQAQLYATEVEIARQLVRSLLAKR